MSSEVKIPFQLEFKEPMLSGKKTATTRITRFGHPGDWFQAFGKFFVLKEVYHTVLYNIVFNHYREEGFDYPQAFIEYWNRIHRRIPYAQKPARLVYFHRFSRMRKAFPSARTVEAHVPLSGVAKPK